MTLYELIQICVGHRLPLELAGWLVGGLALGVAVFALGLSIAAHQEHWRRPGPGGGVVLRPDTDKGYAALIVALTLGPFWWWAGPEVWRALQSPGNYWGQLFIGGLGLSALGATLVWLLADFLLRQLLCPQPLMEIEKLPLAPGERAAIAVYLPHPYRPLRRVRLTMECLTQSFGDQRTAADLLGFVLLALSFQRWWPSFRNGCYPNYHTHYSDDCYPYGTDADWSGGRDESRGPLWGQTRISHQAIVEDTREIARHAAWDAPVWQGHLRIPATGMRSEDSTSLDPDGTPLKVAWTLTATVTLATGWPCRASYTIPVG